MDALNLYATPSAFMRRIRADTGIYEAHMGIYEAYTGIDGAHTGIYMWFSNLNLESFPIFANSVSRH